MNPVQNLGVILRTFWEKAVSYLTLQMSLTDIIEIIIISVLIYYMLVWIKDTRAWMLLRGILGDPCLCFACSFV